MAKLPRYSLSYNSKTKKWDLTHEASGSVVKTFASKSSARHADALHDAIGRMGTVRIRTREGKISEERTYPSLAKLPRYSLSQNAKTKKWELKGEGSPQVIKTFSSKAGQPETECWRGRLVDSALFGYGSEVARSLRSGHIRAAWIRAGGGDARPYSSLE
jgi:hypothetical protein